jgi:hypothetical protein
VLEISSFILAGVPVLASPGPFAASGAGWKPARRRPSALDADPAETALQPKTVSVIEP